MAKPLEEVVDGLLVFICWTNYAKLVLAIL
jgi:hypothetical protein